MIKAATVLPDTIPPDSASRRAWTCPIPARVAARDASNPAAEGRRVSSSSLIRPLATSPRACPPIPSATAHKPAAGRSTTLSSL
jgi:hypothetical protein